MSKVQPSRAGHVVTAGVPTEDGWFNIIYIGFNFSLLATRINP